MRESNCGNKTENRYKSVSDELCCAECFSPIKKKKLLKENIW